MKMRKLFILLFMEIIIINTYAQAKERNPFQSPLTLEEEIRVIPEISSLYTEQIRDMCLTGIVSYGNRKSAIIDRKIVRVGDVIGDKRIVIIKKDKVIFSDNTKRYILELKKKGAENDEL